MKHNYVAKHMNDLHRSSTHKTSKDYYREQNDEQVEEGLEEYLQSKHKIARLEETLDE